MNPKIEMMFEIIITSLKLGMYTIICDVSIFSRYGILG